MRQLKGKVKESAREKKERKKEFMENKGPFKYYVCNMMLNFNDTIANFQYLICFWGTPFSTHSVRKQAQVTDVWVVGEMFSSYAHLPLVGASHRGGGRYIHLHPLWTSYVNGS